LGFVVVVVVVDLELNSYLGDESVEVCVVDAWSKPGNLSACKLIEGMEQTLRRTQTGEQRWFFSSSSIHHPRDQFSDSIVPSHGLVPDQMDMEEPSHAHRTGVSFLAAKKRFIVTRTLVSSVTTVTPSSPVERHKHQHGETTASLPLINQSPAYTGLPATATWIRTCVPQSRPVRGFRLPSRALPPLSTINTSPGFPVPPFCLPRLTAGVERDQCLETQDRAANIAGVHTHTKPSCGSGAHTDGGDRRPGGAEVNHHATRRRLCQTGDVRHAPRPDLGSVAACG
jgi:hypothetical protein